VSDQDRLPPDGGASGEPTADPDIGSGPSAAGEPPAPGAGPEAAGEPDAVSSDAEPDVGGTAGDTEGGEHEAGAAGGGEADNLVAEAEAILSDDLVEVVQVERERDEFRALAQRIQADFENYKKRIVRQQTEHLERTAEDLVSLLQLAAALYDALQKEGLVRIDPEGQPFDPTEHDAVMHEEGDGGDPQVLEVLRAGYRWKGRLLRPAMVKVKG